jgi:hypothetical protein
MLTCFLTFDRALKKTQQAAQTIIIAIEIEKITRGCFCGIGRWQDRRWRRRGIR